MKKTQIHCTVFVLTVAFFLKSWKRIWKCFVFLSFFPSFKNSVPEKKRALDLEATFHLSLPFAFRRDFSFASYSLFFAFNFFLALFTHLCSLWKLFFFWFTLALLFVRASFLVYPLFALNFLSSVHVSQKQFQVFISLYSRFHRVVHRRRNAYFKS